MAVDGQLGAIFGNGRSGTTWLGAIVSSHPDVAYRFEPFKRGGMHGPDPDQSIRELLEPAHSSELDVAGLYQALLPSHPEWEKPPFFRKRYKTVSPAGRALLWPFARRSRPLRHLFRKLHSPRGFPYIIFKEVALERAYCSIVETTRIPVVYLVRHPCAVVDSLLRGQRHGLMGEGRQQILKQYLKDHAYALWERYAETIDDMGAHEKEALLWRANVERCMSVQDHRESVQTIFYENLCREPLAVSEAVLQNFGLGMDDQVRSFVSRSVAGNSKSNRGMVEFGINKYFSVYRDPAQAMSAWKNSLTSTEKDETLALVSDSPAFRQGVAQAHWEE